MNKDLLYRFFNGEYSSKEENDIRQWMEESPENKKIFFDERRLFDTINLLVEKKDLRKREKLWFKINRSWIIDLMKTAAIIIVTLALTLSYQYFFNETKLGIMQKIETPAGQRVNIELSDGTVVWLNSRSKINYPTTFEGNQRRIKLEGEAYFEVAHNAKKPFIVETKYGNIEVLGTKFNLEVYPESGFITSLFEGCVKVESHNQQVILKPNQMAFLENGQLKAQVISDYTHYRWREGLICFKNESFISIMKKFEKIYGAEIKIETTRINDYYYSGKFRQSDGILNALRVLQKDVAFKFDKDEENNIIHIK